MGTFAVSAGNVVSAAFPSHAATAFAVLAEEAVTMMPSGRRSRDDANRSQVERAVRPIAELGRRPGGPGPLGASSADSDAVSAAMATSATTTTPATR